MTNSKIFYEFPRLIPRIYNRLKYPLYRLKFKKIGSRVSISSKAKIECPDRIALGSGITIQDNTLLSAVGEVSGGTGIKISIGDNSSICRNAILMCYGGDIKFGMDCTVNPYCVLYGHGNLSVGNGVRIGAGTTMIPANQVFDRMDIPMSEQGITARGITIEDDIWIGANVTILDGVRIGRGSVVGAGSVVGEDVPPYSIVAGVPARVIKKRGGGKQR